MENNIAIYELYNEDLSRRYIGKTKQLKIRFNTHCLERGWPVGIRVLEWVNVNNWSEKERYWIAKFGLENLENRNHGGYGAENFSEATRKKISIANKGNPKLRAARLGKLMPDYVKKQISKTLSGRPGWNKGNTNSKESNIKNSLSNSLIKKTPEWNKKNSESLKKIWAQRKLEGKIFGNMKKLPGN